MRRACAVAGPHAQQHHAARLGMGGTIHYLRWYSSSSSTSPMYSMMKSPALSALDVKSPNPLAPARRCRGEAGRGDVPEGLEGGARAQRRVPACWRVGPPAWPQPLLANSLSQELLAKRNGLAQNRAESLLAAAG